MSKCKICRGKKCVWIDVASLGSYSKRTKRVPCPACKSMGQSKVIAVDFNGTLASRFGADPDEWGEPVPGAREAMEELKGRGYTLIVNSVVGDSAAISRWLTEHGMRELFDKINESPAQPEGASGKLNAVAYIDDRAVTYGGDWRATLDDLYSSGILEKHMGARIMGKKQLAGMRAELRGYGWVVIDDFGNVLEEFGNDRSAAERYVQARTHRHSKRLSKGSYVEGDDDSSVWVMTTEDEDRDGETVDPEGVDFSEFDLNPVFIDNHNTEGGVGDVILGKVVQHWLDEVGEGTRWPQVGGPARKAQMARIEWNVATEKGREARDMAQARMLNGGSISFVPLDAPRKNGSGGNHYGRVKLLEFTACPVGSNPSAIRVKSHGRKAMLNNKSWSAVEEDGKWYVVDDETGKKVGPFSDKMAADHAVDRYSGLENRSFKTEDVVADVEERAKRIMRAIGPGHTPYQLDDGKWGIDGPSGGLVFGIGPFNTESEANREAERLNKSVDGTWDVFVDGKLYDNFEFEEDARRAAEKLNGDFAAGGRSSQATVRKQTSGGTIPYEGPKVPQDVVEEAVDAAAEEAGVPKVMRAAMKGIVKRRLNKRRAKTMKRKMWVNKRLKSVWLLKSEGQLDEETKEYLEERGLDDVRIEESEPGSEEWVEEEYKAMVSQGSGPTGAADTVESKARDLKVGDRVVSGYGSSKIIRDYGDGDYEIKFDDGKVGIAPGSNIQRKAGAGATASEERAYFEGYDAQKSRKDQSANPYNEGSTEADSWDLGYFDAKRGKPRKNSVESKAEDVAERAEEIVQAGAEPEAAVDAAIVEEEVPQEMVKAVKRIAMKRMRAKRKTPADDAQVFQEGRAAKADGKPSSNNPYDGGTKEYAEWLRGWDDLSKSHGRSKAFNVGDRVKVRDGAGFYSGKVTRVNGDEIEVMPDGDNVSVFEDVSNVQPMKSHCRSKAFEDDAVPMGYRALKRMIRAIEDETRVLHKSEQPHVLEAAERSLKVLRAALKRYKDIENEEIRPDEEMAKRWKSTRKSIGGEVVTGPDGKFWIKFRDSRSPGGFGTYGPYDTEDEAEEVNKNGPDDGLEVKSKRLSKADTDVVKDAVETLEAMTDATDTPKHHKGTLRKMADDLKGLMQKQSELVDTGELTDEQVVAVEQRLKRLDDANKKMHDAWFSATGQRLRQN